MGGAGDDGSESADCDCDRHFGRGIRDEWARLQRMRIRMRPFILEVGEDEFLVDVGRCQMTSPWYREMCSEQQIIQGGNISNDTAQPYKTFPGPTGGLHSLKETNI